MKTSPSLTLAGGASIAAVRSQASPLVAQLRIHELAEQQLTQQLREALPEAYEATPADSKA